MNMEVGGLAAAYALFDRIPDAAREEMGVELAIIGYEVLAAQKSDVAKATGALAGALSLQLQLADLRVRVGLLGVPANSKSSGRKAPRTGQQIFSYGNFYYGRFVEYGRRAQVVLVERRVTVASRRRRSAQALATTYSMKVSALAPRPFVHVERPTILNADRLAKMWSQVLENAGYGR